MAISPWHLLSVIRCDDAAALLADFDPAVRTVDSYTGRLYDEWRRVLVEEAQAGHLRPVKVLVGDELEPCSEVLDPQPMFFSWREVSPDEDDWRQQSFEGISLSFERAELYRWLKKSMPEAEIPEALRDVSWTEPQVLDQAQRRFSEAEEHDTDDFSRSIESQQSFSAHESEGLRYVKEAIEQFWDTYDPDDLSTVPSKREVVEHLQKQGATKNLAMAADLVCRPRKLQKSGLKQNRMPIR
ncbi:hypothetical protein RSO68_14695 [Halomonas saccharevitans]|uniref:Uncharacterized protein n=1 Tax=Halomonas saccharevitans TaxID=416872 RepID=A0ABU3NHT5_9GAMM|nr:hypothetical protein [Halomonas saccharevitans]MDT8880722.1 hypothetical protein [Halomonas saccharevitans]